MIKNLLIGGLFLTLVAYFGFNEEYRSKYKDNQEEIQKLEDTVQQLDSLNYSKDYQLELLRDSMNEAKDKIDSIESLKNKIYTKYDSLKSGIDTVSVDSLAEYIISNFKGKEYRLLNLEDNQNVFMAFTDTTVRDIVRGDIEKNELEEENSLLNSQVNAQQGLIKLQSSYIDTLQSQNEVQANIINKQRKVIVLTKEDLKELRKENDRLHRRAKIITYTAVGGTVIAIALVLI